MIKTYDQFIEEGLFSKKDKSVKAINFNKQFDDLKQECKKNIIEFVLANEGTVEVEPFKAYLFKGDKPKWGNDAVVAEIEAIKVVEDEDSPYAEDGKHVIYGVLKNGEEFPIAEDSTTWDTFFFVSYALAEERK